MLDPPDVVSAEFDQPAFNAETADITAQGADATHGAGAVGESATGSRGGAPETAAAPVDAASDFEVAAALAPAKVKTTPRAKPAPAKAAPVPEATGVEDELAKYSIYFDGTADEFLEATRVAGRRLKPKLSISRSSVVRLALERLSDSMSPDEVAFELSRNAATGRSHTGRPRL